MTTRDEPDVVSLDLSSPPVCGAPASALDWRTKHLCCICFSSFTPDQLEPVTTEPGRHWDVCVECAAREKARGATY